MPRHCQHEKLLEVDRLSGQALPIVLSTRTEQPQNSSRPKNAFAWIIAGPIISVAGIVSYFLVFAPFPFLRDTPWLNVPLALLGCYVSLKGIAYSFRNRARRIRCGFALFGALFSLSFTSLFLFYINSMSYQLPETSQETARLKQLPEFAATDQHGNAFLSSDLAEKNIVLVFYRGHW